ncbi:membrane-associated phospholipid phosphatase [Massilia sp. ST3]|uniref:membrane-associated phospholipid phosphatase n=1 Tax=Massilia sp. ST3 TaxID=2824903 RepID=UPI001B818751|nr:membrane-associated phospholipid phosphatase [Massilia sp. ST3]MBQ5946914.1 membrane-associated phospholipid phosphatase [Massilia sp. ST3]
MISWMHVIEIGHTAVMLPVAGAIAVWLVLGRAWKLALWWCLVMAAGLGVVALSKLAYLGWGVEVRSIAFQALSGHAWRATAVLPVLIFLVLQKAPAGLRRGGVLLGLASSMGIGALLVIFRFHTVSEVLASTMLGIAAMTAFIRMASVLPAPRTGPWTIPAALIAFTIVCLLKPSSLNHRLVDVALYFSGRDTPYRWSRPGEARFPDGEEKHWKKTCQVHMPD